jgi:hypothetical protein
MRNISEANKRGAPHLFKLLPLVPIFPRHILI